MKFKNNLSQRSQQTFSPVICVYGSIFIFIMMLILSSHSCTPLADTPPKAAPEAPQGQEQVQVQEQKQQIRTYEYILSPVKKDKPDEYSRREIESFLCASARDFIKLKDSYKGSRILVVEPSNGTGMRHKERVTWYAAKYKFVDQKKKELLENLEINKWFEERVTLICKGYPLPEDIETVKYFVNTVNDIIGREKFVVVEDADVGNINVEFSQAQISPDPMKFIGESACLQDNLEVAFYRGNNKIKIEKYKVDFEGLSSDALLVKYTPQEKTFGKKNRIIKIHISNISERKIRDMVIIHELLHAIGLSGHSPYVESHLFPLPIPMDYYKSLPGLMAELQHEKLSKLARRMVEMLYRPEILPTMSIKEAGEVLTHLKYKEKTTPLEIKTFLTQKKEVLENRKASLLKKAGSQVERREEIQRTLSQLYEKREKLSKEVEKENKLDQILIKGKSTAVILQMNIGFLKYKLERLEEQSDELRDQTNPKTKQKKSERQIAVWKEDLEVLTEILGEVNENENHIHQLQKEEKIIDFADGTINQELRRIVRQLGVIDGEMALLQPGG